MGHYLVFCCCTSNENSSYKRAKKQGKNLEKLEKILEKLVCREELPKSVCDHSLGGVYQGHRECHIEPDWLLIYRIKEDELVLVATRLGSHSELLGL